MEAIGKKDGNARSGTRRPAARNGSRTDAVQRAQRDFGLRFNVLAGNERQAPALSNRGQRKGGFHPGEGLSDALASPPTKREEGERGGAAFASAVNRSGVNRSGCGNQRGSRCTMYWLKKTMAPF